MIKKAVLIQLGKMVELKRKIHDEWVSQNYPEELQMKWKLVHKVFKCLEEHARGKIKSNIPYPLLADFLLENAEKLNYKELHQEVMKIVFLN